MKSPRTWGSSQQALRGFFYYSCSTQKRRQGQMPHRLGESCPSAVHAVGDKAKQREKRSR